MLEDILMALGSKQPFRDEPRKYDDGDGERLDWLTQSGWKAYGVLTNIVYALGNIGVLHDADNVVEQLDQIVSGRD